MMNVPFLDLKAQYRSIKDEVNERLYNVLEAQSFINGQETKTFEKEFSRVQGVKYTVGCSNGTSAISASLRALGIGKGDEVITVSNTFFATVEAIVEVGAKPIFVDIDPETYLMDFSKIEGVISSKSKALIFVHLYGNPGKMDEVISLCKKFKLALVEDCAQAHLASFDNQLVGSFGSFGTFSFYPGKNLGAYGDAGAIVTSSEESAVKVRKYINHGRTEKYEHDSYGGNFRIDEIQAAVLNVKLKKLNEWTLRRREVAALYDSIFKKEGIKVINSYENSICSYHLYIIEAENRDELALSLSKMGITTGIHYPLPLHLQPACSDLGYHIGSLEVTEKAAKKIISLPIFPELTSEQVDYVAESVLKGIKL